MPAGAVCFDGAVAFDVAAGVVAQPTAVEIETTSATTREGAREGATADFGCIMREKISGTSHA
jgi:hypothetical protein